MNTLSQFCIDFICISTSEWVRETMPNAVEHCLFVVWFASVVNNHKNWRMVKKCKCEVHLLRKLNNYFFKCTQFNGNCSTKFSNCFLIRSKCLNHLTYCKINCNWFLRQPLIKWRLRRFYFLLFLLMYIFCFSLHSSLRLSTQYFFIQLAIIKLWSSVADEVEHHERRWQNKWS